MWTVFTDPKTDCVLYRIFGTEPNKHLLVELLNALLELEGEQQIAHLTYLTREQRLPLAELKHSIIDARCHNRAGREFVVKVQTLTVEGFEKQIVEKIPDACVMSSHSDRHDCGPGDLVGVTLCDFEIWPTPRQPDEPSIPMLSRWRKLEQSPAELALPKVEHVFLELPKYTKGAAPETAVERWAHFFRVAEDLDVIPPELSAEPFRSALEQARTASFTRAEWEAYDRAKIARQDARGAISLARRVGYARGFQKGLAEGLRHSIEKLCGVFDIPFDPARRAEVGAMSLEQLEALLAQLKRERRWG